MRKTWKDWEGEVLNGEFRLGEYLGGSERAGVFLTSFESRKAALKLIPVPAGWREVDAEAELLRLRTAKELSHPHLLQIFQAGRAKLDDTEALFVVMEYAEENLAQILPNRPLAAGEVREMLGPALEALEYVHGRNLVHGRLKPANVMAVGDRLKLSSDGISRSAERGAAGEAGDYGAPEVAQGRISAASDVWSLGMLLAMALTQRLPQWDASREEIALPDNLAAPFEEIARHCLRRDPRARWSVAEITARAGFKKAVASRSAEPQAEVRIPAHSSEVPKREPRQSAVLPQPGAARRTAIPAPPAQPIAAPRNAGGKNRSNAGAYVAAAIGLAVIAIFAVPRLFRGGGSSSQTASTAPATEEQPIIPAPAETTGANSGTAQVSDRGAGDAETAASSAGAAAKPEGFSAAREATTRRGLTVGQVAEQVLPDVPRSARDSIRGTVRVGVWVSVDSSGEVTEAELDSAGPSKYFARLALDSAQHWKFDPPKMEGRDVLSDWVLRFEFTTSGTKVVPVETDP